MIKKTSSNNNILAKQIGRLMRDYYADYYRDQLGLKDWEVRVESRLREEDNLAKPNLDKVQNWIGLDFAGKQVLVVGAGTGAESVVLHQRKAKVFGIEPFAPAFEILQLKSKKYGIPSGRFHQATAEKIPFDDDYFDLVYCYTVIEHVQNVEKSIDEMIRVCKVGGIVFIQTPDYRFPYEGHYKASRIPFSSKWLTYLQYKLAGKPVKFLRSVNFVNARNLDRIFMKRNVLTTRVNPPWLRDWAKNRRANAPLIRFTDRYGIGKDQFVFLRKLGER